MAHDWKKGVSVACTSARVIAALCDELDQREDGVELRFTDRWPLPYQGALLEAEELGLPDPYIWDID